MELTTAAKIIELYPRVRVAVYEKYPDIYALGPLGRQQAIAVLLDKKRHSRPFVEYLMGRTKGSTIKHPVGCIQKKSGDPDDKDTKLCFLGDEIDTIVLCHLMYVMH